MKTTISQVVSLVDYLRLHQGEGTLNPKEVYLLGKTAKFIIEKRDSEEFLCSEIIDNFSWDEVLNNLIIIISGLISKGVVTWLIVITRAGESEKVALSDNIYFRM